MKNLSQRLGCMNSWSKSKCDMQGPMYFCLTFRGHAMAQPERRKSYVHQRGAQWLSGRVLDSRPKGCGFEPDRRHCVVSLSKYINPSLVLVQPRKTRPFITERLLMGRKESNQTNKQIKRTSKGDY